LQCAKNGSNKIVIRSHPSVKRKFGGQVVVHSRYEFGEGCER
jgi:hypothetical protein